MKRDRRAEIAKRAGHELALEALLRTARRSRNLTKYTRKAKHKARRED